MDKIEAKSPPKSVSKTEGNKGLKRIRVFVAILSCVLFVISLYFIYVSFTTEATELKLSDIKWRLTTIFRLLVALLGYVGAIFTSKRFLILTMALIVADIVLTFGLHYMSFTGINSQYNEYLVVLANSEDITVETNSRDCDFIKVFRRRIVESLILISFHVIYVDSILNLIHTKEKISLRKELRVKPHPKWPIVLLTVLHFFYGIYLFWSKTFRNDGREEIVRKKDFTYILLWTLLALLSIFISIVSPFALIQIQFKDKFFLNFFIATVILSTFLGSAKFLLIVSEEFLSESPKGDYFCNFRLTSVDNLGSILILLIINKVIISLLLSLSQEIRKEMKVSKAID